MVRYSEFSEKKLIIFWLIGSLAILFGAWIAGHVEKTIGVSDLGYFSAMIIALILIMFGGLAWVAVAISVAHHK